MDRVVLAHHLPFGDSVITRMAGGLRRNPAVAGSRSSALERGRSKLWVIGLLGCDTVS